MRDRLLGKCVEKGLWGEVNRDARNVDEIKKQYTHKERAIGRFLAVRISHFYFAWHSRQGRDNGGFIDDNECEGAVSLGGLARGRYDREQQRGSDEATVIRQEQEHGERRRRRSPGRE